MIYKDISKKFSPRFEIVSCYIECDGNILLLHRPKHKSEGGKWGVPAGKMEVGETPEIALLREIKEETGILLDKEILNFLTKICVRHSDYDFVYHMYRANLENAPEVKINPQEHQDYIWKTPERALEMNLVTDLDECIKMYY